MVPPAAVLVLVFVTLAACEPVRYVPPGDSAGDTLVHNVPPLPNTESRPDAAPIATDKAAYEVTRTGDVISFAVMARYGNESDSIKFIARCGATQPSYRLARLTGGEWHIVLEPVCPAIAAAPMAITPRGRREDTLVVRGSLALGGAAPRLQADTVAGTYRLIYDIYSSGWDISGQPDPAKLVPMSQRYSTPFVLRP